MKLLESAPHRRYDPLRDSWVLVSPGRTDRPWEGAVEPAVSGGRPSYDPDCYLCPGNRRAGSATNPEYTATFVFDNDFAALRDDTGQATFEDGLLRADHVQGACRVVCYSPRHDLSLGDLSLAEARAVIDLWADQTSELGARFPWVQVFENRGPQMGASNPHPHGQIWAVSELPTEAVRESETQARHLARTGRLLLSDYVDQESGGPRVVVENADWLVVVPFWAVWPFETLVLPKLPVARLADLSAAARDGLAATLHDLLARYDALYDVPFPYSAGWHQAPFDDGSSRVLAAPCSLLPAAAALGDGAQVHGRLRAAVRAAARPEPRRGGREATRRSLSLRA